MKTSESATPQASRLSSALLAKNAVLSLVTQCVLAVLGIILVPWMLHSFGAEVYGVLTVTWLVLGHLAPLDLGLSSASARFVAQHCALGRETEAARYVQTALIAEFVLGGIAATILWLSSPTLATWLHVSSAQHGSVVYALRLMACALPAMFLAAACRGGLQARQRLDLDNLVTFGSTLLTYCIYLLALVLHSPLSSLVEGLFLVQLITFFAYLLFLRRILPALTLRTLITADSKFTSRLTDMLAFGGWVSINAVLMSLIRYFDRWIISYFLGVTKVVMYTIPYQLLSKLGVIPESLFPTLLPAFASMDAEQRWDRIEIYYCAAHRYVAVLTLSVAGLLYLWAPWLLAFWISPEFSRSATVPMRILACGFAISLLAPLSGALLYGLGRPHILTWLYLFEAPFALGSVIAFTYWWGLPGAALSYTARAFFETSALWVLIYGFGTVSFRKVWRATVAKIIASAVLILGAAQALATLQPPLPSLSTLANASVAFAGVCALVATRLTLYPADRALLRTLAAALAGAARRFSPRSQLRLRSQLKSPRAERP
jgi:O-antigen/teichoic acid export membrane protein